MSFLFPCTISFPATFTRENFNCFPIFTTWLQFSTFLNGIFIGGFDACFQLTDSGETLSRISKRTHLQAQGIYCQSRFIWVWHYWGKRKKPYPFLTSSKTLLTYVAIPRLLIHNRKHLSSREVWASSVIISAKDIFFVSTVKPFLQRKIACH